MWAADLKLMCDAPFEFTKRIMSTGTVTSSFTSTLLEAKPDSHGELLIKDAAASLYGAGVDTTHSSVYTFFLAMTCFPEVQRKAQRELDSVVGRNRLPVLADRDHLPYIHALCLEVLRWQSAVPLGLPRRLNRDDVYAGYFIPKGTVIIPNIWKFLHDSSTYPEPFHFNPDRFIAEGDRPAEPDPRQYVFGYGRRVCPGMRLAEATLFLFCSRSLATLNIAKVKRGNTVIDPIINYTPGAISHACPFECAITPRSANSEALA